MEWVLRSPTQVLQILAIERIPLDAGQGETSGAALVASWLLQQPTWAIDCYGCALSIHDTFVLSFTGACAPEPGRPALSAGACAAVCQVMRRGVGLAPLTLFVDSRPLGKFCSENTAALMAIIRGLRRLLRMIPAHILKSPAPQWVYIVETQGR